MPDQVFNGVFYNLDAQVKAEYQYEDEKELYEIYEKIGEGAFSIVYRALFKPTMDIIAVKILRPEKDSNKVIECLKTEAALLNKLNHPNIIKVKHLI